MTSKPRYFLSTDQSSHHYVVPVERRAEWDVWSDIPEDDERSWTVPSFATLIDLHEGFTFTDWSIE